MNLSATRVRAKARAAVRRREETVEQEEMESGELNLVPYLDMVTNLMLFLLASVSAGLVLVQIDTTLPDRKAPSAAPAPTPATAPDEQPLKLFVSIQKDEMILWSLSGLEGTLAAPKARFPRTGKDGAGCDGPYMCESNSCVASKCVASADEPQPVFDYRALNRALVEIATRRWAGKPRKAETYQIMLQADGAIPYSTIVSTMAALRCALPEVGVEPSACALPTDDPALRAAPNPISPDGKLYVTEKAPYDPKKMALFHEIGFSSGFE